MKLKISSILVLALAFTVIANSNFVFAEDGDDDSTTVKTEYKQKIDKGRMKIEYKVEDKRLKVEERMEKRDLGSSTRMMERQERREMGSSTRMMVRREIKEASSTEMFKKMKEAREDIMKKMKQDVFELRKKALVNQLTISLENIANIRLRLSERITRLESEGKNMTEAKAALATADDKIAKAKVAVNAFAALNVTVGSTGSASSTTEVELTKPRQLGDAAIKAVKDARDALKLVIKFITPAGENKMNSNASTTSNK